MIGTITTWALYTPPVFLWANSKRIEIRISSVQLFNLLGNRETKIDFRYNYTLAFNKDTELYTILGSV